MSFRLPLLTVLLAGPLAAQVTTSLPTVTVYSPSVANQAPAGPFAMPVSALRYEPLVDLEARNSPEAANDITIRGDIFENTGFKIGAVSLFDPQTGHYLGELPIAPEMLGAPTILTGAEHAMETTNSTVGAIAYQWRPITQSGVISAGIGDYRLQREEVYDGEAFAFGQGTLGVDADYAHSVGAGTQQFGDSRFTRGNARLQYRTGTWQTDLFAGYQTSFLGWPNLYTPFGSDESDSLQTTMLLFNSRVNLGAGGQFYEFGFFWRRNKDDYAFNRFAPLGVTHPFQHTTWIEGGSMAGLINTGPFWLNFNGEATTDFLKSTSLTFGPYQRRTLEKVSLVPEERWGESDGYWALKAGGSFDQSDRNGSTVSPIGELARYWNSSVIRKLYASYAVSTQLPSYTALKSSPSSGLFFGNPNLGRETSRNAEIGAEANLGGWALHGAVFYRRDQNLVDWTYLNGVFGRTANAVNINTWGGEITARHSWTYVDIVLGYTYLAKDPNYEGAAVTASFYALNYARDRATAAFTIHLTQDLELRSDNEARIEKPDALRTSSSHAFMSSLGIIYHPSEFKGWEASFQVDNLSNSSFQEIPSVPPSGRQYSFTLAKKW